MSPAFPFTPIRTGRNEGTWNEGIVVVELNTQVSGSDASVPETSHEQSADRWSASGRLESWPQPPHS